MSRMTAAQVAANVDALAEVVASMNTTLMTLVPVVEAMAQERAKVTAPAPARKKTTTKKPAAKKVAPKPTPKGAQTREVLSRKDWNRTLTAKARLAGKCACAEKSIYSLVVARWDEATRMRDAGVTPDEVLALLGDCTL